MPSILVRRAAFSYDDGKPVLADVDLHLTAGFTGLVGENGAGKTTLLALLAGDARPDKGSIVRDPPDARVNACPQTVDEESPLVTRFGRDHSGAARSLRGRLSLDPEALERWETLSPGERKRWQIGAALAGEPDVLLLDEPETHLDEDARGIVVAALLRFRGVGIVVSHDRALLSALTTRTIRVHRGQARLFTGPYDEARRAWEAEASREADLRAAAVAEETKLAAALASARRVHASADASRDARRRMKGPRDHDARSAGEKFRASSAEKRVGRAVAVAVGKLERQRASVRERPVHRELGGVIRFGAATRSHPWPFLVDAPVLRAGAAEVLRDVRVAVPRDGRIRIEGPNGAGKSTLLAALARGAQIGPSSFLHLPQDLPEGERRAIASRIRALAPDERGRVLSMAAALGFDPGKLSTLVAPSPGEARKLALALALCHDVSALLLDEPDNHLDLPSRERLERALEAFPGALVVICHDPTFARRATTTTLRVAGSRVVAC